jgi:hypothetical protein
MLLAWDPSRVEPALKGCGKTNIQNLQDRLALLLPVLANELPDFVNPTPKAEILMQSAPEILREWLRKQKEM